eukprot:366092-Chlamydomonas_euryale.AAC.14
MQGPPSPRPPGSDRHPPPSRTSPTPARPPHRARKWRRSLVWCSRRTRCRLTTARSCGSCSCARGAMRRSGKRDRSGLGKRRAGLQGPAVNRRRCHAAVAGVFGEGALSLLAAPEYTSRHENVTIAGQQVRALPCRTPAKDTGLRRRRA